MGWSDRLQRWLLGTGLVISAVLLVRFAIDFSEGMKWWFAAPLWLLVITTLAVGAINVLIKAKPERAQTHPAKGRALLIAAIPIAFLASTLDCTGLSWQGCSPFCTFVKLAWIPLIAAASAVYFFSSKQVWLTAIAAMAFVALIPHCVCYNVGNAWWIDRMGASPLCYGWGFVVSIIAVAALRNCERVRLSLALCFTIIAGAAGFFVSHHYFQFPW